MRANSRPLTHTVWAKRNLSAHLLLISDDMSDAKWEIWISFLCRQSLIHWQKAQMWEDDFSNLDPSRSTRSGSHVVLRTRGGCLDGQRDVGSDSGLFPLNSAENEFKVHLTDVRGCQRFSVWVTSFSRWKNKIKDEKEVPRNEQYTVCNKEQLVGYNICCCTCSRCFLLACETCVCVFWIAYSIPITSWYIFVFANVVFGQPVGKI